MTSNQTIAVTTVFSLGLALAPAVWANPASDACAALANARSALYSMTIAKDKSAQDAWNAKVQAARRQGEGAHSRSVGRGGGLECARELVQPD